MQRLLALAVGSVLLSPVTALALPITYTFSGVIVSVASPFPVVLGDPWSFAASADTTSLAQLSSTFATYPASGSWTLGSFAGTFTGGSVVVSDNRSGSQFSALVFPLGFPVTSFIVPSIIGGVQIQGMIVDLFGAPGLFPPDFALPTSVNLADFPVGFPTNRLTIYGSSFVTHGAVTSVTVTPMPPAVPEPTSALLMCTGLVALGIRRFRR